MNRPGGNALVLGAGAVGGYYGGRLARSGCQVTFVARGANLEALQREGLRVESQTSEAFHVRPLIALESVAAAASHAPFDLALICVKARDTVPAIGDLGPLLEANAVVLSLQNGVECEEVIERSLAIESMPRAVAYVGAEQTAPGIIRHDAEGWLSVGELDGASSPRLERTAALFERARVRVEISKDIRRVLWQKLAWNASFNVVTAVSNLGIDPLLADPDGRALVFEVFAEVEAVARAQSISFDEAYAERVVRVTERSLASIRPSTLQDRQLGKPLEHDALTGAVVRFGERLRVPTPVCRSLDAIASLLSEEPSSRSGVAPENPSDVPRPNEM